MKEADDSRLNFGTSIEIHQYYARIPYCIVLSFSADTGLQLLRYRLRCDASAAVLRY
jgi:hypothetical protein